MPIDAAVIRSSLGVLDGGPAELSPRFYRILFERHPELVSLFDGVDMDRQATMLLEAITAVVDHLEDPAWLADNLQQLGARHVDYGVTPEMYPAVGACLVAALQELGGARWDAAMTDQWLQAYDVVTGLMTDKA